jgi:8-amino-7-oxononanoate synthase
MSQNRHLAQRLRQQRDRHLWRIRRPISARRLPAIQLAQRQMISFASNDYLGLAQHPQVIASARHSAIEFGIGSAGSALVGGYTEIHAAFEQAIAHWLSVERALLFPSGYMANLALASGLLAAGYHVLADKLCHASLVDTLQLSGQKFRRYPHVDTSVLQRMLGQNDDDAPALIMTDGVFSVTGALAPLVELSRIAAQESAGLIIDDTHGIGVLGANGLGTREYLRSTSSPLLYTFSLAKTFGCSGAIIAGKADYIEHILQFARPYMFTSAIPPMIASAALTSLQLIQQEHWRRQRLQELITYFHQAAKARKLSFLKSVTPIQTMKLADIEQATRLADYLRQQGFWVSLLRPPAVSQGCACLRFTLTCLHGHRHICDVLDHVTVFLAKEHLNNAVT